MLGIGVYGGFCFLGFCPFFYSWSQYGVIGNDTRLVLWSRDLILRYLE